MTVAAVVTAVVLFAQGASGAMPDGTDPWSAMDLARHEMVEFGWDDHEFVCLIALWWHESRWEYQADNPTSSAYGIPQALTRLHGLDDEWKSSPLLQIRWGLRYISDRYGTPCAAWDAWRDRATRLPDGRYWGGWY